MPIRIKNVAAGFVDGRGVFHPVRKSVDYDAFRAGEDGSKSDGKGGARGKRTGRKVKYRSSVAKGRARSQASAAGRKGAAAKKRYAGARKRTVKKRNPVVKNPKNPLTQQWKPAKVRKLPSGDVQIMLPLAGAIMGVKVVASRAKRKVKRVVKRAVKRVRKN
ncbi:hypothetical protein LCGC14_2931060, partial [marine sediment metagenome]